jgi:hypothetical protein
VELAAQVEKAAADPVKKVITGRSGGEGWREAWWREWCSGERKASGSTSWRGRRMWRFGEFFHFIFLLENYGG